MTAVMTECATGRTLITDELFGRLVRRIVADEKLDRDLAARIVDQSLAFLGACALDHDAPLAPSELVDIGWHTFILHTREYVAFCERVAGEFLHHVPTGQDDPDAHGERAHATLVRTVRAIERAGFTVDAALWPAVTDKCTVKCSPCHNGCSDDPPPAV